MIPLRPEIEWRLENAGASWKWHLFLRRSLLLAMVIVAGALSLGVLMQAGWVPGIWFVAICGAALTLGGLLAWMIIVITSVESSRGRSALASAIERSYTPLLDRLNTLVFLRSASKKSLDPYANAIEKQTVEVLARAPRTNPVSYRDIVILAPALATLALLTLLFYGYFQPWRTLAAAEKNQQQASDAEAPESLEIPDWESPEQPAIEAPRQGPWGEVRISQPGRDLHVSSLEVVPLRIEAVANRPLSEISWFSAAPGRQEEKHSLPPSKDPRYATYQTELAVPEQDLNLWDVLTYYARATAEDGAQYESDLYFLDVIPFPEELAKLPGGTEGPACAALDDLTAVVEQHQEVMRQTHRLPMQENQGAASRAGRFAALKQQQEELALAAKHFQARLRNQFPDAPLASVGKQLTAAEKSLSESQQALDSEDANKAAQVQRRALEQLARARKELYDQSLAHPDKFNVPGQNLLAEAPLQSSDDEQWRELEEQSRQQAEDAEQVLDDVERLLREQKAIEGDAQNLSNPALPTVAPREQKVNQSLQQLAGQHPETAKQVEASWQQAEDSTQKAGSSLRQTDNDARQRVAQATRDIEKLRDDLTQEAARQRNYENASLRQQLRENIGQYANMEQQPTGASAERRRDAVDNTDELVQKLDRVAEQTAPPGAAPTAEAPPPSPLKQALSDERKQQLQQGGQTLKEAQSAGDVRKSAGQMKDNLEQLADALDRQAEQTRQLMEDARLAQQLQQMASDDQLEAARQFVQKSLLEQRDIERAVRQQQSPMIKRSADRQKQLNQSMTDYQQSHPEPFQETATECQRAGSAMRDAEQAIRAGQSQSQSRANQAASQLQKLDDALEALQQRNRLADAYRLKQMVDKQVQKLNKMQQKPSEARPGSCKSAAGQCNSMASQAGQLAQQGNGSDRLSQSLRPATTAEKQQQIRQHGQQLSQAQAPADTGKAAGQLGQDMQALANALQQGLKDALSQQQLGNRLSPTGQQALDRGMRQLESEARQNAGSRRLAQRDAQRLRKGAMSNLAEGISSEYGHNEDSRALLERIQRDLKEPEFHVDLATVQQLLREIQNLRREVAPEEKAADAKEPLTTLDPATFPPDYRQSIQTYFEELSKPQ